MVETRKEDQRNGLEQARDGLNPRAGVYRFGQFELDLPLYELRRAGEACPLEPQVFDVLAYLVRRQDRLVSKEELLDAVWGHRYVTQASLTSRIMAARKALGDTGQQQRFIRTVRGRGYRFVAAVEERPGEAGSAGVPARPGTSAALLLRRQDPASTRPMTARDEAQGSRQSTADSDAELAQFRRYLDQALSGSSQVVLVTGESGPGKSALIEALLTGVRQSAGSWMAWGQPNEVRSGCRPAPLHAARLRGGGHSRAGEPGVRRQAASSARRRARRRRA